jgi:tetratricopeptide (TPR) repeat protein
MLRLCWLSLLVVLIGVASCRHHPEASQGLDQENGPSELQQISSRISADSLNASLFNQRAQIYLEKDMINQALADINRALALEPSSPEAFITLSRIYLAMGSPDKAKEALNKATDLAPESADPWFYLGYLHLVLRDYELAREFLNKALLLQPDYPKAYFHLGLSFLETGDTTEAIRNFQWATQQDQRFTEAYIELGTLLYVSNPSLAAGYLENAIALDSSDLYVMVNLGLLYQQMPDTLKAQKMYQRILDRDSSFFLASYNLGYICLMYKDDLPGAIGHFDHTIRMNPTYVDAWYNRGLCYELLGQPENARANYQEAIRLMPDYPRAIEGLNRLDERIPASGR